MSSQMSPVESFNQQDQNTTPALLEQINELERRGDRVANNAKDASDNLPKGKAESPLNYQWG